MGVIKTVHVLYNISFHSALAPESGTCCDSCKQDRAHWEQDIRVSILLQIMLEIGHG